MLFRKLLPLLAVLSVFGMGSAKAQFGVYGMVTGQRFGGITCPAFAAPCAATGGHAQSYGGTFGAFYDFYSLGPVRIGADLRGAVLNSNKRADSSAGGIGIYRQYEVLGGVRASVGTPISWLRPYAEIAAGYTHNNASGVYTESTTVNSTVSPPTSLSTINFNPSVYANQTMLKGMVGADVRLTSHLDFRAIELSLGEAIGSTNTVLSTTNTVSAGGTATSTAVSATSPNTHSVASIGTGVVLHF